MDEQLDALQHYSLAELKTRWQKAFGRAPPGRASRKFLIRNLAYHLQAQWYGKLPKATYRRLKQLYDAFCQDPDYRPRSSRPVIKPGTRLVREWQGVAHTVTVTKQGFEYRDTRYGSLSAIAREITGTRWSGPTFFGLNGKAKTC